MANVKKSELFRHAQRYIQEVFAERLRQQGFLSYKGENIHWYRLVNDQVVQAIYFVTRHVALPVSMTIGCGCHPLFIPPVFQKSPYMYAEPGNEQIYLRYPIVGSMNTVYRIPDALIECPADEYKGSNILDGVLSLLDSVQTPFACYETHKEWRKGQIENGTWFTMSPFFADEVIYWEDKSLYPFCKEFIAGYIGILNDVKQSGGFLLRSDHNELARLIKLKEVFDENRRHEYLQTLCERERETLRMIRKYTTIPTNI